MKESDVVPPIRFIDIGKRSGELLRQRFSIEHIQEAEISCVKPNLVQVMSGSRKGSKNWDSTLFSGLDRYSEHSTCKFVVPKREFLIKLGLRTRITIARDDQQLNRTGLKIRYLQR